jgi:hypothetical protein
MGYRLGRMGLDRELIGTIRRLDLYDLRRVLILAAGLLESRQGGPEAPSPSGPAASPSYRRQLVRCGKAGCTKCPHGPYWYAYWREGGRVRSRYVGKELPPARDRLGEA